METYLETKMKIASFSTIIVFSAIAFFLLCLSGCEKPGMYTGSVKVVRVNGEVTEVEVSLPGQIIKINNREEATALITHLDALSTELKAGRDQFKVQEPVVPNLSVK